MLFLRGFFFFRKQFFSSIFHLFFFNCTKFFNIFFAHCMCGFRKFLYPSIRCFSSDRLPLKCQIFSKNSNPFCAVLFMSNTLTLIFMTMNVNCQQLVQVSTLSTVDTALYTVYNRYNYPHCLQWMQLSTLSTVGTAIYTVYNR